jgi:hypothetical protein
MTSTLSALYAPASVRTPSRGLSVGAGSPIRKRDEGPWSHGRSGRVVCRDGQASSTNDSIVEPEDSRRARVVATCLAALLLLIALISSVMLACRGSDFGLVAANSYITRGAGGFTVAIAALVLPFAVLATPLAGRAND